MDGPRSATERSAIEGPGAPRRIVLLGGGDHLSDILSAIEAMQAAGHLVPLIGFVDDAPRDPDRYLSRHLPYLGTIAELGRIDFDGFANAIGYPATRELLVRALPDGPVPVTIVHPLADVSPHAVVRGGAAVLALTHLSADVVVEQHALVSYGALIGHDSVVGPYASVMPGAVVGGRVSIGPGALIGARATVLEGRTIGARARVGAGAVVTHDVPDDATVVGVPARRVNQG